MLLKDAIDVPVDFSGCHTAKVSGQSLEMCSLVCWFLVWTAELRDGLSVSVRPALCLYYNSSAWMRNNQSNSHWLRLLWWGHTEPFSFSFHSLSPMFLHLWHRLLLTSQQCHLFPSRNGCLMLRESQNFCFSYQSTAPLCCLLVPFLTSVYIQF